MTLNFYKNFVKFHEFYQKIIKNTEINCKNHKKIKKFTKILQNFFKTTEIKCKNEIIFFIFFNFF